MPATYGSLLDVSRPSLAVLERATRLRFERFALLEVSTYVARGTSWPTVIVTEDGELWMIGGIWPINPGATLYISGGGPDSRVIGTPVPPGIVKRLRFGADQSPGAGESYRYTLFKNGSATDCTFTVTGSTRKGGCDVEVTCSDGDELCVEVVVSAGAPLANHSGSIQHAPAV